MPGPRLMMFDPPPAPVQSLPGWGELTAEIASRNEHEPSPGVVSSALVVTWITPARAGAAATSNHASRTSSSTMPQPAPTAASLDSTFALVLFGRLIAGTRVSRRSRAVVGQIPEIAQGSGTSPNL